MRRHQVSRFPLRSARACRVRPEELPVVQNTPSGRSATVRLLTCLGVELELTHLRHFLAHYTGLGIPNSNMHLILNALEPDDPNLAAAARIVTGFGAPPPRHWIAPYTSDGMWSERRRLQRDSVRPGEWVVNADVDEHHRYPAPLPDIVRHCEAKGYNGVQGFMIDRLASGGALQPVRDAPDLASQFPIEAEVSLSLLGRGEHHGVDSTTKLMLHRAEVLPGRGGHNPAACGAAPRYLAGQRLALHPRAADPAFRFAYPFRVDHYKWTATRETTIRRRIATPGVSPAGEAEGGRMSRYLARHGRVRPEDVTLRSEGASSVRLPWKALSLRMRLGARLRTTLGTRHR